MLPAAEIPPGRDLYLTIAFERWVREVDDTQGIIGVVTVEKPEGGQAYYEPFAMEPLPPRPGEWEHIEYRIAVPGVRSGEYLKFYFWNQGRAPGFLADDLVATVHIVRPY